ncbi:MAG: DUF2948 family protein [Alphaproteobacteria bacterium]|nr:DUF2948 family protein [Alphaproteobacteria bacterium]
MLQLRAEQPEDLVVLGGFLQDATVRVGDMAWLPKARRFALVFNRFMWEECETSDCFMRVRTGMHFENVVSAKTRNVPQRKPDEVLELLTIHAVCPEDGNAVITLYFAGGCDIRLEAEIIEAEAEDLCEPWETPRQPRHEALDES